MSEERRLGHDKRISIMEGKCVLNDSTDYLRAHFSERYKTNEGLELLVKSVKDSTTRALLVGRFCKLVTLGLWGYFFHSQKVQIKLPN